MYLKNVTKSLDQRWTINFYLPDTPSFTHLLKSLRPIEKDFIAGYIIRKEWNVGSPMVLDILRKSGILRMSDYLIFKIEEHADGDEEVQLIFNDLLEVPELTLLADLIENIERTDSRSQMVAQCVNEGFRRLLQDISSGAHSLNRNYMHELNAHLSNEQMEKLRILNLKLLLDISECSLMEAVTQLSEWLNDMNNDSRNNGLNDVIKELLFDQEKVVNSLTKKVFSDKFHGWKWYANVLYIISGHLKTKTLNTIRTFLKDLYTAFLVQKNRNFFLIMVISARVLCAGDPARFGDYSQWYRNQFSDMRYTINRDDFVSTIEMLQTLISYESDVNVLEVYVRTAIAPATLCNDLVLSFKQMCRSKIERLKCDSAGHGKTVAESVVLIDDDEEFDDFM